MYIYIYEINFYCHSFILPSWFSTLFLRGRTHSKSLCVFVSVNMGFVHVLRAHIVTFDWSVLLFNERGGEKV